MNCVLRARLSDGATLIFKQSLPYVAKYPDIAAPIERLDMEVAFYAAVANAGGIAIRMPEVVGYNAAAHIFCMQDLGAASDMTHLYAVCDHADDGINGHLTALTYWLWKLHALEVDPGAFANQGMRALNHAHIFEIPYQADNGVALSPEVATVAASIRANTKLRETARKLGQIYLGQQTTASRPCLLHGDYYPGSWIDHPRMGVMVIDPEFCFAGAPEFDVGVMLAHLTFAGFEQMQIMRLLQAYVQPAGFDFSLATAFAGLEVIRRLLGVAQLPLSSTEPQKAALLQTAAHLVTSS
jgi:5-methylthioribose kinase